MASKELNTNYVKEPLSSVVRSFWQQYAPVRNMTESQVRLRVE